MIKEVYLWLIWKIVKLGSIGWYRKVYKLMGFEDEAGGPIKCKYCGSKNIKVENVYYNPHSIDGQKYICSDCGQLAGYWAYGCFDPNF